MRKYEKTLPNYLTDIKDIFGSIYGEDGNPHTTWFVAFGVLLYLIRDLPQKKPFDQDLDIGIMSGQISGEELRRKFNNYGYGLKKITVSDTEKDTDGNPLPFQMVFAPTGDMDGKYHIDVFFWVKANGYMWHTYDFYNEENKNGIPGKYVFKGVSSQLFQNMTTIEWNDIAVNTWMGYGALLDAWYPHKEDSLGKLMPDTGWRTPNPQYGQSKGRIVELTTCRNMYKELK